MSIGRAERPHAAGPRRRRAPGAPSRGVAPLPIAPARRPAHALLDTSREPADSIRSSGAITGLSPKEQADRIVASILAGGQSGPVVLCMPGTLGPAWQSSILETARSIVDRWGSRGPIAVVSIPYHNGIADVVTRFAGIGTSSSESVFALVVRALKANAPHRPIVAVGESQGAWVIGNDLQDPELAAAVTRVALFAKPGFQKLPRTAAAMATHRGAALLPGPTGVLEFRHTDDIVPSLFTRLGTSVVGGFAMAIRRLVVKFDYEYTPHHYDIHGPAAAAWLLDGVMPDAPPVHRSKQDL